MTLCDIRDLAIYGIMIISRKATKNSPKNSKDLFQIFMNTQ